MPRIGAIALPLIALVLLNILGHCEMSIYPGLRRKPLQQTLQQTFDVPSDFLSQLMEENARRRLQHQFEQQLELINMQMYHQRQRQQQRERFRQQQLQQLAENDEEYSSNNNNNNNLNNKFDQYDNSNAEFTYKYPNVELDQTVYKERIPFAVGPTDPRYFEEENREDGDELDSHALDDYEEYAPAESRQTAGQLKSEPAMAGASNSNKEDKSILAPAPVVPPAAVEAQSTTFHRIKPQSAAAAAVAGVNVASIKDAALASATNNRHDISDLIEKLQRGGKSGAIINGHESALNHGDEHIVVRQHMGMDGEMGMYMVALIAGVSAAITVGLIALAVAWIHNRTKAAADVEYPAYGVTGPNKDISPSGDRKLAQSAQMYHYQHQKQQIIAMENRQAAEGSCGLSDVESDDDNEEGDYTVYECPGLAPTGEMEVKNPLFLDETPLTPGTSAATTTPAAANVTSPATNQQPQTNKKNNGGKAENSTASSSEEKKSKKNKK